MISLAPFNVTFTLVGPTLEGLTLEGGVVVKLKLYCFTQNEHTFLPSLAVLSLHEHPLYPQFEQVIFLLVYWFFITDNLYIQIYLKEF